MEVQKGVVRAEKVESSQQKKSELKKKETIDGKFSVFTVFVLEFSFSLFFSLR